MKVASALLTDDTASPQLVSRAVERALQRAGLTQAGEVLLFLSPEFARITQAAVTAASHRAACLQVFGGTTAGVLSDEGWAMDRPAVAALVIGDLRKSALDIAPAPPILSLCGSLHLPENWYAGPARAGLLYADTLSSIPTPVWQGARIGTTAELRMRGCAFNLAMSSGVDIHPQHLLIKKSAANELLLVTDPNGGHEDSASASLRRVLPTALRGQRPLPIHLASVALHPAHGDAAPRLIPILSANADGSITLSETLPPGSSISWALRLPAGAEANMQHALEQLRCTQAAAPQPPAFGLFFSCIGRGPFFYAGDDRDLNAFRTAHPGMPFVGAYGSGQIAPANIDAMNSKTAAGNCLLQNSVLLALAHPV